MYSMNQSKSVLSGYEDELKRFFDLKILLRSLIESKFSVTSYDEELIGSDFIADISLSVAAELDGLSLELFNDDSRPNRRWLTIQTKENRIYRTLLRKLSKMAGQNKPIWESIDENSKLSDVQRYFAPYIIDEELAHKFIEDLNKKILSLKTK